MSRHLSTQICLIVETDFNRKPKTTSDFSISNRWHFSLTADA